MALEIRSPDGHPVDVVKNLDALRVRDMDPALFGQRWTLESVSTTLTTAGNSTLLSCLNDSSDLIMELARVTVDLGPSTGGAGLQLIDVNLATDGISTTFTDLVVLNNLSGSSDEAPIIAERGGEGAAPDGTATRYARQKQTDDTLLSYETEFRQFFSPRHGFHLEIGPKVANTSMVVQVWADIIFHENPRGS